MLYSLFVVCRVDSIMVVGGESFFFISRVRGSLGDIKGGFLEFMFSRWFCIFFRYFWDYVEGVWCFFDSFFCIFLGFVFFLYSLEMFKNLSDDMKEVVFFVRSVICFGFGEL